VNHFHSKAINTNILLKKQQLTKSLLTNNSKTLVKMQQLVNHLHNRTTNTNILLKKIVQNWKVKWKLLKKLTRHV